MCRLCCCYYWRRHHCYPALLVVLMHKTLSEHFVKDESDEDQQRTEKKKEQQKIMLFVSAGLLAFGSLSMSTTTLSTNRNCVLWQNIGTRNHSFLLTSFLTQTTSHPSIHPSDQAPTTEQAKQTEGTCQPSCYWWLCSGWRDSSYWDMGNLIIVRGYKFY